MMTKNKEHQQVQIPVEAKFVIYIIARTTSTIQKTLLLDDEENIHKIAKNWQDIKNVDLSECSYGVKFKDKNHKELPYIYIIRSQGTVKDILDTLAQAEYDIAADFEQSQASEVLDGTGLRTYIQIQLKDNLDIVAFDPNNMIIVENI